MYEVEILPTAMRDIRDAVAYVKDELENPESAAKLAREFFKEISALQENPYRCMLYPHRLPTTEHEYRRMTIFNYSVFYWIEEPKRKIVIARMIYSRRDILTILR